MKLLLPAILIFTLVSCFHKPTDHDLRVAAKKFIRKELVTPATAQFAPDDKITIIREKGDKTFYVSIYADARNANGAIERKQWNLHLLYKGGSLPNLKNWQVIK